MAREAMALLRPAPQSRYLDGTLGAGGHTEQILIQSSPDGKVLGLDRDEQALTAARERLREFGSRLVTRQASFSAAGEILCEMGWLCVDGAILDLGVSSHQLTSQERGFSFASRARLDMRMDRRQTLDAHQLVNSLPADELEKIFREFGEEPQARSIARAIVSKRQTQGLETTEDLARLIERIKGHRRGNRHPATQSFQALRIAVNQELHHLNLFLENGFAVLKPRGRMVIISFHSLEDRIVKGALRKWNRDCLCPPRTPTCRCGWNRKVRLLTKRPLVPSAHEIAANPRARSAKLRAVERL